MAGVFLFADHAISTGIDKLEDLRVIAAGNVMPPELFQRELPVAIQIQSIESWGTAHITASPRGLATTQREHRGKEN
jgi:hypothetical protein